MRNLTSNLKTIETKSRIEPLLENKVSGDSQQPAQPEQDGLTFRSFLVSFNKPNENGYVFTENSFDKFLKDYYEDNSFNIPIDLLHNMSDIGHLVGKVMTLEKTTEGIYMTGWISPHSLNFSTVSNYMKEGIIQGVSTCGLVGDVDNDGNITSFHLLSISLVATPAETRSHLVKNTRFVGFDGFDMSVHKEDDVEDLLNLI